VRPAPDAADPRAWEGRTVEDPPGDIVCERGYVLAWLEATENANPLFWDDAVARELAGGPVAPPTMLSVWMRPLLFVPGRTERRMPLGLHFALKEALGLPDGIVAATEMTFGVPLRPGDRVRTTQRIRRISEPTATRLGVGRFWTIDVTYRTQRDEVAGVESYEMFAYRREPGGDAPGNGGRVGGPGNGGRVGGPGNGGRVGGEPPPGPDARGEREPQAAPPPGERLPPLAVDVTARTVIMGAAASRDWQPQHHDHAWAVARAGARDVFLNTPTQAGWIERYLTDWAGPRGRPGALRFRMRRPICAGDRLVLDGVVRRVAVDPAGCTWADVDVTLSADGRPATRCAARIAIPRDGSDNPWARGPGAWTPEALGPLDRERRPDGSHLD
jgi:acyl dehydratase